MPELAIDRKKTALVVIDLQKGISRMPARPYPAQEVIRNAANLAGAFRKNGMPVFLVHVVHGPETMLKVESDESFALSGPMPPDWSEIVPELGPEPSDIVIAKRQWGAFYGTDLELQLTAERDGYDRPLRDFDRSRGGEHGEVRLRVRFPAGLRRRRDDFEV